MDRLEVDGLTSVTGIYKAISTGRNPLRLSGSELASRLTAPLATAPTPSDKRTYTKWFLTCISHVDIVS